MANDNARKPEDSCAFEVERKMDRSGGCRPRDHRPVKIKDKLEEGRLPTPPPDPQCPRIPRERGTSRADGPEDDEEDLVAYLSDLGLSPFEGHPFDYDTTSNCAVPAGAYAEEAFEHLDRLCVLTEQILELRDRSSKYFRRVRGLERVKALRNADRRLETALAHNDELASDFPEEDTGFAESLLDAMLSNSRDHATQRRNERARSPSSSRRRSRSLAEHALSGSPSVLDRTETDRRTLRNVNRNGGPKISKWTRVKAAFKWERACTNDLAEIVESGALTSPTPTTRYLKIPDVTGSSWSGSALSPCTSEISSSSTPIGRVSPASSSNEEVFDDSRKNIINYSDRQSPQIREDRKKDDVDVLITDKADSVDFSNEQTNRSKPLIRIISDADATVHFGSEAEEMPEVLARKPTPTLTITIPSNEEEIRSLSSPESTSPLPSSAQDSGGSSPQRPKARQNASNPKENKRQHSTIEEAVTPAPKIQRQDSKWNKVRRAFLTNTAFSVPPSPVRVVAAQSFAHDGTECRTETTRRDYQALRERFGAEFHRKLVEWERLKGGSPRAVTRNVRDTIGGGLPLNEERLTPEFKKKLQDWKRAKKSRRTGATIERAGRRRLTDWQLWRTSAKPDSTCYGKSPNLIGSRGSCASIGSAGSLGNDGKQHLCEDFVKRMEAWRRMSEAACPSSERPKQSSANRVASDATVDETEFLALEKLLSLFGQRARREQQENDARELNDCFDGDTRLTAGSRGMNCGNEVLIRTSVGSYRFEGISREFTRKLYDWEKYRGISPRSSTFRLLGPSYTPFTQDSDEVTLAEQPNAIGKNHAFHWAMKRSKSDGSIFEGSLRDESLALCRSTSLHSLNNSRDKLEDINRMSILPASNNLQSIKDHSEDTAVEDSEPEAMIVDIEDVIEETASPLARVQPHQTPVYSVAASETTSIAVPLGTVTSSHEPSPVFLVEAEDDENCWKGAATCIGPKARSNENSPSPEDFPMSEEWRVGMSLDEDRSDWGQLESSWCKDTGKGTMDEEGCIDKTCCLIADDDPVKYERLIGCNQDSWVESDEFFEKDTAEANRYPMGIELSLSPIYETNIRENNEEELDTFGNDYDGSIPFTTSYGSSVSATGNTEELTDLPCVSKGANEMRKAEDPARNIDNERRYDVQDIHGSEKFGETIPSAASYTYELTETLSDCRDSREISPSLSNLNTDDNKDTTECRSIGTAVEALADYENYDLPDYSQNDRYYEVLNFNTGVPDNTIGVCFLYEPLNCHEPHDPSYEDGNDRVKESPPLSELPETGKSNSSDTLTNLLTDSTVRTTPVTVPKDSETRCLERILINEETLDKIIVPTESAEDTTRTRAGNENCLVNADRNPDETASTNDSRDNRPSTTATRGEHTACVKKDNMSTRNVFVKTKRMIFAPFRRTDDRAFSRKEGNASVDARIPRPKSKSKSRSASPKLYRPDALLRVSLSLPWPLRSTSKESEIISEAESARCSESKTVDAVTTQRGSSACNESVNGERNNGTCNRMSSNQEESDAKSTQVSRREQPQNRNTSDVCRGRVVVEHLENKEERDEGGRDRGEASNNAEKRGRGGRDEREEDETKCDRARYETLIRESAHCTGRDAVPSDLMHKLRILSDAAARREGRVAQSITSTESRSSRIQRAKENFLSRRGGPYCRTVMESTRAYEDDHRREQTSTAGITTSTELFGSNVAETSTGSLRAAIADSDGRTETVMFTRQDEASSSTVSGNSSARQDDRTIDTGVRADLVKSASAGMINVDPGTFGRLVTADRGCESLPRTIAKRRDSSGPLARIVNKLKLSRLIRGRNPDGGSMSTISTLCRQSLLIDVRGNSNDTRANCRETVGNDRAERADDEVKSNERSIKSSKVLHE